MDFFWNCFKARGSIEAYLASKELEREMHKKEGPLNENMFFTEKINGCADIQGNSN